MHGIFTKSLLGLQGLYYKSLNAGCLATADRLQKEMAARFNKVIPDVDSKAVA